MAKGSDAVEGEHGSNGMLTICYQIFDLLELLEVVTRSHIISVESDHARKEASERGDAITFANAYRTVSGYPSETCLVLTIRVPKTETSMSRSNRLAHLTWHQDPGRNPYVLHQPPRPQGHLQ